MSEHITISDVLYSLSKRGFYTGADPDRLNEQLAAVMEELGEVARMLRRAKQGKPYDNALMAKEVCDVIIASICLGGCALGDGLPTAIIDKCHRDETRGYLHGVTNL